MTGQVCAGCDFARMYRKVMAFGFRDKKAALVAAFDSQCP
jgi:hypothetical protein